MAEPLDGLAVYPFSWPLTDALYYLPHFADLRERYLGTPAAQPPARVLDAMAGAESGVLLFHPFLLDDEERFAVLADVVAGLRGAVPLRELRH